MSTPIYTLSIDGAAPVTTESLACQVRQRQRVNQGPDSLTLRWLRGAGQALPITDNQRVVVYQDGVPFFTGWHVLPKVSLRANDGSFESSLLGPWHWFQEYTFCRLDPALIPDTADITTSDIRHLYASPATPFTITNANAVLSASAVTGMPIRGGTIRTVQQELEEVIEYVRLNTIRQQGTAAFQTGTISLPTMYRLLNEIHDQRCESLVRGVFTPFPDGVVWFDYSTSPPTLNVGAMRNATPVAIAYGDLDLSEISLTARTDMQVSGVVIKYEQAYASGTYFRGNKGTYAYPAGAQMNDAGVFVASTTVDGSFTPDGAANPILAQALYASLSNLVIEGALPFVARTPRADAHPGSAWTLTGDAPFAALGGALWTQSVTDDCATGRTTCQLGYPRHLGIRDLTTMSASLRAYVPFA